MVEVIKYKKLTAYSIWLLVLFGSLLSLTSAHAKHLLVGVEDIEYFPIYAQREGLYAGFSRELLDAFADQFGHTLEYKPMPINRLYGEFVNGRVDLKFPDNEHWAQDKKVGQDVSYSAGALDYVDGVMVLPGNLSKGKESLKKLGTVRGFTAWDYLGDVEAGTVAVQENSDLQGLVSLMKAERIDGVYFNVVVARYFLKHTLFEKDVIVFDKSLPHSRSAYHLSSIKYPDVIKQFNEFLISNKDLVESLKNKYDIVIDF